MDEKDFDKKITETLLIKTEKASNLKAQVWLDVEKQIYKESEVGEGKVMNLERKKARPSSFRWSIVSTAAVLILVFMFGTETGQAGVKKLKEILAPEKMITEELEGQKEKSKVSLQENKEANYAIYIDKAMYGVDKVEGKDRIVPLIKPSGDFPEIFMEISQEADKEPREAANVIQKALRSEFATVRDIEPVDTPVKGLVCLALNGQKYNSKVVKYYFMDNEKGGTFVIKMQYFLEAEEGHGARFENMLKEFRITPQ